MLKKINGLTVFLTIIIAWLLVTFYSIIEEQERPQSRTEVSRLIREDFFNYKARYEQLASFAMNVNSYSDDWYFENSGEGLQYFSETAFDSCKIPISEYIRHYYVHTDTATAPCYVPDFVVPAGLSGALDSLQLSMLHYKKEDICSKKRTITFTYKNSVFSPEKRTILFRYFPEGMCKEMMETIRKSDNKWNWAIYLDKNWVAESIKKKH